MVDREDRIPLLGRRSREGVQFIKVEYENTLKIDSIVTEEEEIEDILPELSRGKSYHHMQCKAWVLAH